MVKNSRMKLYGFTILRNGIKYDYPFRESLASLSALCEEVFVALGNSEDGTEAAMGAFPKLHLIPTIWDESKRKGGLILSEQTNIALSALEKEHPGAWGIYLQADEVLADFEMDQLRCDIEQADREGCDAVSFRYLHFWQAYDQVAINKRWYPQEIRAIKLSKGIESYGDAQSFKGFTKRFESDVAIYHYGHVREPGAYERKKLDFGRWWHASESELARVLKRGDRKEKKERTLRYLGPHPIFMKNRIGAVNQIAERVLLFGNALPEKFTKGIQAKVITATQDKALLKSFESREIVPLQKPSFLETLFSGGKLKSRVPNKMLSPQAREWTPEFQATLRLSEKGICSLKQHKRL